MNTDERLRFIEKRVQAFAARLADMQDRHDEYAKAISSGVPGTVVERDRVWRNLRDQVDEAAEDYRQLQARAEQLRREAQR